MKPDTEKISSHFWFFVNLTKNPLQIGSKFLKGKRSGFSEIL